MMTEQERRESHKKAKVRYRAKHHAKVLAYSHEYNLTHKDAINQRNVQMKYDAIMLLGGRCVGWEGPCGIMELDVLEIDNVIPCKGVRDGSGSQLHRKLVSGKIKNDNLQVLCANCHSRKTVHERRESGILGMKQ